MASSINLPFFASSHLFQPKMWMKCANVNNALLAQPAHQIQMRTLKNYILGDISMIAWSVWIECKPIWFKLNRTLDHYFYCQITSRFASFFSQMNWHLVYHQFIADFNWNTSDLCCNISSREQSKAGCLDVVNWELRLQINF